MRKIILTGPESSGKTTLAYSLASRFNLPLVDEYARVYLQNLNRKYAYHDLETIAHTQNARIESATGSQLIICDTDILTIIIWAEDKFGNAAHWMEAYFVNDSDSIYILCKPDFAWVPDDMREDEKRRDLLFEMYKKKLITYGKEYFAIGGTVEERMLQCSLIINKLS